MGLNADDPRPVYLLVAETLRAAIATGVYQPGDRLPSQTKLAETYDVAPMTVQSALRQLVAEGLVVSRQGSGTFVRQHANQQTGLQTRIERAFEQAQVTIDFAGFSGEVLHDAVQQPLNKILLGRLRPESVTLRLLMPDFSQPTSVPRFVESEAGNQALRERSAGTMREHVTAITSLVTQIHDQGLAATVEVRVHHATPLFELFLINTTEAFFGFYPVREHIVPFEGQPTPIYDLLSKDVTLFHHNTESGLGTGTRYVQQAQDWFDSTWTTIAITYE